MRRVRFHICLVSCSASQSGLLPEWLPDNQGMRLTHWIDRWAESQTSTAPDKISVETGKHLTRIRFLGGQKRTRTVLPFRKPALRQSDGPEEFARSARLSTKRPLTHRVFSAKNKTLSPPIEAEKAHFSVAMVHEQYHIAIIMHNFHEKVNGFAVLFLESFSYPARYRPFGK